MVGVIHPQTLTVMPSSSRLYTLWDTAGDGGGQAARALAMERWMETIRAEAALCDAEAEGEGPRAEDPDAEDEVHDDDDDDGTGSEKAYEASGEEEEEDVVA